MTARLANVRPWILRMAWPAQRIPAEWRDFVRPLEERITTALLLRERPLTGSLVSLSPWRKVHIWSRAPY